MNFAELSAQRYSLRKFSDRPVEDALLQQVLEAGRNAPTAHNNQPQRIFVLQSPEAMAKADACMGCHFHPPVLLAAGLIVGGISCILSRALFAALPKQAGRQRRGSPFQK